MKIKKKIYKVKVHLEILHNNVSILLSDFRQSCIQYMSLKDIKSHYRFR